MAAVMADNPKQRVYVLLTREEWAEIAELLQEAGEARLRADNPPADPGAAALRGFLNKRADRARELRDAVREGANLVATADAAS